MKKSKTITVEDIQSQFKFIKKRADSNIEKIMNLRAILHGKTWTPQADNQLELAWKNTNKSIATLATEFDRSTSSISARLVKLLLAENRHQARALSKARECREKMTDYNGAILPAFQQI